MSSTMTTPDLRARSHLYAAVELDFDVFPADDMPRMVSRDGYAVVLRSVPYGILPISTPIPDTMPVTLMVRHIPPSTGERRTQPRRHPLDETRYANRREACRAAYNAGVAAFYVSDGHITRYGL